MTNIFREPVQLHTHGANSMLDAIPHTKEWVAWCLEHKIPAMSITDHGNCVSFFDAVRTKDLIKKHNDKNKTNYKEDAFQLIPGIEAYLKLNLEDKGHHHLTMWAISNEGYFNLQKLSSEAFNDTVSYFGSTKARMNFDLIKKYRKGLKFGSGCLASIIGDAIYNEDLKLAEERYLLCREIFGDDMYIEFHLGNVTHEFDQKTGLFIPNPHTGCCPDGNKQKAYNLFLWDMVKKYGGKPIPVTDAHFIHKHDHQLQTTVLKAGNSNGWYFHHSHEAHDAESMFGRLRDHLGEQLTPEIFSGWIDNTFEVLEEAKNIKVKFDYHLPQIQVPEQIKAQTDNYDEQLRLVLTDKIKEHGRWRDEPEYVARFEKELDVISKNETLNFLPYFLVYEDIGNFLRTTGGLQGIARGSAGGSLLSYYLKIIHIDPIAKNLPFERFLSHARIRAGSFPDIDLDIQDTFRSVVVEYLKSKYGPGFAQIATFNKIKTKNAIKDAMFSLYGKLRTDPEVEAVCREIPDSPQGVDEYQFLYGYTDSEDNYNAGIIEVNPHVKGFFQKYPDIEELVKRLLGLPRGWSRHASAFVISSLDLPAERVPTMIMKAKKKDAGKEELTVTVTQFDAGQCEKSGLVKADILGVRTLSQVRDCVELIKQRHGVDFLEEDKYGVSLLYRLPDDKDVYVDFYNCKTDSSFQFNTPLIKRYLPEFCPLSREDLAAMTALCRPGALDFEVEPGTSAAQLYMDVKNGKRDPLYIHDDLRPILGDTYSVAVYQEQIMQILVDIGGFSLEESDIIRGAIGKKKKDVIQKTYTRIRESTLAKGWTEEQAEQLCKMIEAFSRYSFNRSHSCAYAELGYVTMYLKHHYPLEWWTAVLNHEPNEDKVRHFAALLHGTVKPPSLKTPCAKFTIVDDGIVTPMWALKGVGPNASAELASHGSFESFEDFMTKIRHNKLNIGSIGALLKGRACDVFMDPNKPYLEARKEFMEKYLAWRKSKTKFPEELVNASHLDLFLMEKQVNQVFGKSLLSDMEIRRQILDAWPGLVPTGKKGIPFKMKDTPIVNNVRVAEGFLDAGYEEEIGMILLFEGSEIRKGLSKKTGKPWSLLSVSATDGYQQVEIARWKETLSLRWPVNTLMYVRGTLRPGFKTKISINAVELEKIELNPKETKKS